MAQELLTLQNLAKYYTSAQSVVVGLNQLNLTFRRSEFVAITGESGSGKSTMAHVLGGILPYEGGELLYKGQPTSHYDSGDWERYRRDRVSFISQSYGILPGSSVLDNVTCALRLVGMSKEKAQRDAEDILKKVELWDLRRRRAAKLSSGQKQRLSIARALAKPAPVLIADEPTGNLDAENSAMVISLLAEAAKDRLVLLITHEFSEAADYVTRHIELHDGRVTMDAQLREAPEPIPRSAEEKRAAVKEKKGLSWFVARFQIKARPVWTVLMLALFALTVFAMFAFSGTFISNLDDTFTYYYDNSAFRNGNIRRIVAVQMEGGEFTQEDLEKILSLKYVESVEKYGYVTDIQYAYREGVDYEIQNSLGTVTSGVDVSYVPLSNYSVARTQRMMPFLRTVPLLPKGKEFLTAGRMPESIYEVVAAGGEELLGEKLTVLLQDQKNWSSSTFIRMEVTVVGVTDYGSHLYFHSDLGRVMMASALSDTNMLYLPMPAEPNILGTKRVTSASFRVGPSFSGMSYLYLYYRAFLNGTVATEDEIAAAFRQQAAQRILDVIEDTDKFLAEFSLDGGGISRSNALNQLSSYVSRWLHEDPIQPLLEELGLDYASLADLSSSARSNLIAGVLGNPETVEYVKSVAEPVFQQLKEVWTQEKEAFLALDLDTLSIEEATTLLRKWWLLAPDIQSLQPGDVVVSSTMLDEIATALIREKKVSGEDEEENPWDTADYLVYGFPVIGAAQETASDSATKSMTVIGSTDVGYHRAVLVHPDDFDVMTYPGSGDQITIYVEDYAYVDRVLDSLHEMGYVAISPYQEGTVKQDPDLAEQRMQTLRVCLMALVAVIILQILLLRAMFSMETESYRLLSHIGLNRVTAQRSVFWQIMLFALGGQLVGVGLITACGLGGVAQVVTILRYLPLSYRLALCLIHLCASAFTAVWTMRSLKKQVFPQSGAEPDLDWDSLNSEEVEA